MKSKIILSNVFTCLVSCVLVLKFTLICEKKACVIVSNETLRSNAMRRQMHVPWGNTQSNATHCNNTEACVSHAFRYDRSLETGFGDRISVYLCVAAAAATVNKSVYVWWHPCDKGASHHAELCLDEVNMRVEWPSNLHVLSREDFYRETANLPDIAYNTPGVLASNLAFDGVYTTAWKTMRLPGTSPELRKDAFARCYKEVCRQFRLKATGNFEIPSAAYSVLHIRGGDKHTDSVEFNTNLVLSQIPNGRKIVVITDDNAYANHIIAEYRRDARNNNSLDFSGLPPAPQSSTRHEALFHDFHALMLADEIIQHSPGGWSAFSNVVSMMQSTPLLNTWHSRTRTNEQYVGILSGIQKQESCPIEFFSSNRPDGVAVFLGNMNRQHEPKQHHRIN